MDIVAVALAFLIGAIPWGYLVGRFGGGFDVRQVGSGGTGATNILRTMGKRASALVFVLDFLKGLLPVVIGRWLGLPEWVVALMAVATVAGHCWSPFIGFKGGKGVATGAGAAIALFSFTLVALPVLALIVWRTRFVSLGSLAGTALAALLAVAAALTGYLDWASALAIVAMSAIIFERHRANIARLRMGTERRIGESIQTKAITSN